MSRSELLVGLFLLMVASSAILGIIQQQLVGTAMAANGLHDAAENSFLLFAAAQSLTGLALATGVAWVFPTVRRQSREQIKMLSLTRRSNNLEQAALTDPLTGMHNRRYFDAALAQYLKEFARIDRPVGLMMIDLDHFKAVNDTHGHDAGDRVLKVVANHLLDFSRHHDIVARLGGEEFALVAPNASPQTLLALAERLRKSLADAQLEVGTVPLRITVSIGLATSLQADTATSLMKRADVNLYRAKQRGRNRVCA